MKSVHVERALYHERSHRDVTHWFVKARFEASIFGLPDRHLWFLEPEVIKFGREGAKCGRSRRHDARPPRAFASMPLASRLVNQL